MLTGVRSLSYTACYQKTRQRRTQCGMDSLNSLGVLVSEAPCERQLRGSRLPQLTARHAEVIQHLQGSCHPSPLSCKVLTAPFDICYPLFSIFFTTRRSVSAE